VLLIEHTSGKWYSNERSWTDAFDGAQLLLVNNFLENDELNANIM
jgi:hypothetical protein